jgi:hypothetical protein
MVDLPKNLGRATPHGRIFLESGTRLRYEGRIEPEIEQKFGLHFPPESLNLSSVTFGVQQEFLLESIR